MFQCIWSVETFSNKLKSVLFQKLLWLLNVRINSSSDLKNISNSLPLALVLKSFCRSVEIFWFSQRSNKFPLPKKSILILSIFFKTFNPQFIWMKFGLHRDKIRIIKHGQDLWWEKNDLVFGLKCMLLHFNYNSKDVWKVWLAASVRIGCLCFGQGPLENGQCNYFGKYFWHFQQFYALSM